MTSQSPLSETATLSYSDSWAAVNRMVREGNSWSGRERNCALLNTGDGKFIDASNTMGLGFADDARNFVSIDWDGDGDLDLLVKNRTAPMVRYLRNDGADGQSLRLRLRSTGTNWAGIGARVEVRVAGAPLVRELRAGTGFLTQGSSWLHFGIGAAESIESVQVRWPDGDTEEFTGCAVGERYELKRGKGIASLVPKRSGVSNLKPSTVVADKAEDRARVALTRHLPAPPFQLTNFAGDPQPDRIPGAAGRPLLVTFWASWCSNCIGELREWSRHQETWTELGVDVLALSVDDDAAEAKSMWEILGLPFDTGMSTKRTTVLFDMLQRLAIDRQRDMAVPTSFLFDSEGRIARIYRGPVDTPTLEADVKALKTPERAYAGAPFPGRAFKSAGGLRLFDVARRLLDVGAAADALYYLNRAEANLRDETQTHKAGDASSLADALMRAGMTFMQDGDLDLAHSTMTRAKQWSGTEDAIIWFASAKLQAVRGNHDAALADLKSSIELDDKFAMSWHMLGSLKLVKGDMAGCIAAQERAVRIDPGLAAAWSELGVGLISTSKPKEAHAAFKKAVELDPNMSNSWTGLGTSLVQLGQKQAGLDAIRKALALNPKDARALDLLRALGVR